MISVTNLKFIFAFIILLIRIVRYEKYYCERKDAKMQIPKGKLLSFPLRVHYLRIPFLMI